jgi:hypothetical protein
MTTQTEYLQSSSHIPPLPKGWKYVLNASNGEAWDYAQKEYVPVECYELSIEDADGNELAWQMINHPIGDKNQKLVEAANKAYHKLYSDRKLYPHLKITLESER